jgi:LPXTG-motif cell wall-anchored protein
MGKTGAMAGTVMVAFGLTLVGIGGWLAFKSLRQQGVL